MAGRQGPRQAPVSLRPQSSGPSATGNCHGPCFDGPPSSRNTRGGRSNNVNPPLSFPPLEPPFPAPPPNSNPPRGANRRGGCRRGLSGAVKDTRGDPLSPTAPRTPALRVAAALRHSVPLAPRPPLGRSRTVGQGRARSSHLPSPPWKRFASTTELLCRPPTMPPGPSVFASSPITEFPPCALCPPEGGGALVCWARRPSRASASAN